MNTTTLQIVTEIVADTLVYDGDKVKPDLQLSELGADSLDMMEIVAELEHYYNVEIPESDVHKFVSTGAIASYLEELMGVATDTQMSFEEVASNQTMENITHAELVTALVKPGEQIVREINERDAHRIHMVIGIAGEAGELLDAIKKNTIYRKELDINNVIEELGDLEFYMEGLRQSLGISRQETLDANIAKLSVRYAKMTYTDEDAQARADKTE